MYHSRSIRISWRLAKSASTIASGMQWNARSHAAYHGYSHLSERLPLDAALVVGHVLRAELRGLERIRLGLAQRDDVFRVREWLVPLLIRQTQDHFSSATCRDHQWIVGGCFRPEMLEIDGVAATVHDEVVDAVLDEWRAVLDTPQPRGVRLVVREQQLGCAVAGEPVVPERAVFGLDDAGGNFAQHRLLVGLHA